MRPGSRTYWTLVGVYLALLFAAQPFLGFGIDAFKARWGEAALATAVGIVGVSAGIALLAMVVRLVGAMAPLDGLLLAIGATVYGIGVLRLEIPQERLHYVEYGLLAGLIYVGLRHRVERPPSGATYAGALAPALLAFAAGSALGLLDEALQGALWPRRYFDWRDVGLNARASSVGVLLALPLHAAWLRRRGAKCAAEREPAPDDGSAET